MTQRILRNRAKCKKCGDIIESKHRHDWVQCSCKSIFVDGGREYLRYGFPNGDPEDWIEDLTEYTDEPEPPKKKDDRFFSPAQWVTLEAMMNSGERR